MCLSARHLSACLFHVSTSGAIKTAATANSRRLSQQNPYKTCVSLVELAKLPVIIKKLENVSCEYDRVNG